MEEQTKIGNQRLAQTCIQYASIALQSQNYQLAASYYQQACRLVPNNTGLWLAYEQTMKLANLSLPQAKSPMELELLACEQELAANPGSIQLYSYLMRLIQQNSSQLLLALDYLPNKTHLTANLITYIGNLYKQRNQHRQALSCFQVALFIHPGSSDAFCSWLHSKMFICDWSDRQIHFQKLVEYIKYQVSHCQLPAVQPFHAIIYPLAPEDKLVIARLYAEQSSRITQQYPEFEHQPRQSSIIKIGYVSSDFSDHPLSHLLRRVFEFHNREQFEVFAFALTDSDRSEFRIDIQRHADHFFDLSSLDVYLSAYFIWSCGIDILVNLNGYTKGAKTEIFALKPGKVQISFLGYPSTMGAEYIPYLVSDRMATPLQYTGYYSEKIIYMPHTYFVNDYAQTHNDIFSQRPRRTDIGLPEDKFIFCNLNQLYKIDPQTFRIWMRILKRAPNSVLWLLRFPAIGEANIKKYAQSQGVDPDRIVFTDVTQKKQHIQNAFLGDLFLDTPLCNGHTTCQDVLWSGLPVLTHPLVEMASRVGASLVTALECPELIARTPGDYEEKAVRWATGPKIEQEEIYIISELKSRLGSTEYKKLRDKVSQKRLTAPLFNTRLYLKNFEKGMKKIIQIYDKNEQPQHIQV